MLLSNINVGKCDDLILLTRYASALRLMLGAAHLVALRSTLVEQSSSACLQASLQTRSAPMRPIISTWLLVK